MSGGIAIILVFMLVIAFIAMAFFFNMTVVKIIFDAAEDGYKSIKKIEKASSMTGRHEYPSKHVALCQIILQDGMSLPPVSDIEVVYDSSDIKDGCIYVGPDRVIAKSHIVFADSDVEMLDGYDVKPHAELDEYVKALAVPPKDVIAILGCEDTVRQDISKQLGGLDYESEDYLSNKHAVISARSIDDLPYSARCIKHLYALRCQDAEHNDVLEFNGCLMLDADEILDRVRKDLDACSNVN